VLVEQAVEFARGQRATAAIGVEMEAVDIAVSGREEQASALLVTRPLHRLADAGAVGVEIAPTAGQCRCDMHDPARAKPLTEVEGRRVIRRRGV